MDDADGDAEFFAELVREPKRNGGKIGIAGTVGIHPAAGQTLLLRRAGGTLPDIEHAERGGILLHFTEFVQLNGRGSHAELHVGLSGSEPDFADENIFDFHFFSAGEVFNRKNIRSARGFNRGKTEHKISG